jgi:ORF6N domain
MPKPPNKLSADQLGQLIYEIRGQRVMLDSDLAAIYGVEAKALNRAVKRNPDRFPRDFVFQLTSRESEVLRYQFGTLKTGRGQHRKYLPYVFTEHGAAMQSPR